MDKLKIGKHDICLLIDNCSLFDKNNLIKYIEFCIPKGMPKKFSVDISDYGKDCHGNPIEIAWDGTATLDPDNWLIEIVLSKNTEFPILWWPGLKDNYMRGMHLDNKEEYIIYALCHEMRHIWQEINKDKELIGGKYHNNNLESDSDLYAIIKLNQWRNLKI